MVVGLAWGISQDSSWLATTLKMPYIIGMDELVNLINLLEIMRNQP